MNFASVTFSSGLMALRTLCSMIGVNDDVALLAAVVDVVAVETEFVGGGGGGGATVVVDDDDDDDDAGCDAAR